MRVVLEVIAAIFWLLFAFPVALFFRLKDGKWPGWYMNALYGMEV